MSCLPDFICPKSRYGSECEYTCTCQKDSKDCAISEQCGPACDPKVSSTCKHESVRRYMKLPYIQIPSIVECPAGTYGINCDENCSSICQNCDGLTGRCPTCPAGMHGDFCEEDCEMFTYGPGCELQCSTNCLYNMCNEVDGECIRCPAGQYGSYCDHVCDKHYYGNNCNFKCSQECEDQICRGTDGVCLSCPPGRQGSFCDT
ncbi:cell death abnormality protein 1-like, partial [Physella acuta]|uniref:cell death abnormality protein 1-like n=1 Tax=Physella acuta TaxID=109671 RepID=UPI0027DD5597